MSDKDLLGKADGLMRRATLAPPATGSDTGAVPVLTDFVEAVPGQPLEATPTAAAPARPEADALAAEVMARVEAKLRSEMERLRRELGESVAQAVREALAKRPVK